MILSHLNLESIQKLILKLLTQEFRMIENTQHARRCSNQLRLQHKSQNRQDLLKLYDKSKLAVARIKHSMTTHFEYVLPTFVGIDRFKII